MSRNMSRMKKEKKLFIILKLRNFMKKFMLTPQTKHQM